MADKRVAYRSLAGGFRLVLGLAVAIAASPAFGGEPEVVTVPPHPQTEEPNWSWIEVSPECQPFLPGGARDSEHAWNQLLSFASCVQDASAGRLTEPDQIEALVDELSEALSPALLLYVEAIEHGPPVIKLRAAYQAAMAHVALITRLRASISSPMDVLDASAWARYRSLHDALEPHLVRAQQTAWFAFAVIDRVVTQDPALARDPVMRNVVRDARVMLRLLGASDRVRDVPFTAAAQPL
ncbi:MAG TPA: hypothetical protein VFT22_05270 [Kofleriaceae bacterium]|nr:hypothetical protein [Kofleriaceae bacterium]